jgi:hypothetical protein
MKLKPLFSSAMCAVVVSAAPAMAEAPAAEAATPVIVVFKDGVSFDGFRTRYAPDARFFANQRAWDYLDRGVAGAVQVLESQHGFKADHMYSASIRGFAGRRSSRASTG